MNSIYCALLFIHSMPWCWAPTRGLLPCHDCNNIHDLNAKQFLKIGQSPESPAYKTRRDYFAWMKQKAEASQAIMKLKSSISELDTSGHKSYEGGCEFLLNWYKDRVAQKNAVLTIHP